MAGYVYFTEEQKARANAVNLVDFLTRQGETLLPSGREKRLASDHSITVRGNRWYDHACGKGGCAIDFVQQFYGSSFPEAVTMLLNGEQGQEYQPEYTGKQEETKVFALPKANQDMRRVFAYLTRTRCIDRNVVSEFAREKMIYEDAKYHNVVFVGYDAEGVARHAHKRGTYTQGTPFKANVDASNPRYSFHYNGVSDMVYVFEAPIDLLSFITLYQKDWQRHSYVSLCGVAAHSLFQVLADNPQIQRVALCLDNDKAGIQAREKIQGMLLERGYGNVFPLFPCRKDWNEDLQVQRAELQKTIQKEKTVMQMV